MAAPYYTLMDGTEVPRTRVLTKLLQEYGEHLDITHLKLANDLHISDDESDDDRSPVIEPSQRLLPPVPQADLTCQTTVVTAPPKVTAPSKPLSNHQTKQHKQKHKQRNETNPSYSLASCMNSSNKQTTPFSDLHFSSLKSPSPNHSLAQLNPKLSPLPPDAHPSPVAQPVRTLDDSSSSESDDDDAPTSATSRKVALGLRFGKKLAVHHAPPVRAKPQVPSKPATTKPKKAAASKARQQAASKLPSKPRGRPPKPKPDRPPPTEAIAKVPRGSGARRKAKVPKSVEFIESTSDSEDDQLQPQQPPLHKRSVAAETSQTVPPPPPTALPHELAAVIHKKKLHPKIDETLAASKTSNSKDDFAHIFAEIFPMKRLSPLPPSSSPVTSELVHCEQGTGDVHYVNGAPSIPLNFGITESIPKGLLRSCENHSAAENTRMDASVNPSGSVVSSGHNSAYEDKLSSADDQHRIEHQQTNLACVHHMDTTNKVTSEIKNQENMQPLPMPNSMPKKPKQPENLAGIGIPKTQKTPPKMKIPRKRQAEALASFDRPLEKVKRSRLDPSIQHAPNRTPSCIPDNRHDTAHASGVDGNEQRHQYRDRALSSSSYHCEHRNSNSSCSSRISDSQRGRGREESRESRDRSYSRRHRDRDRHGRDISRLDWDNPQNNHTSTPQVDNASLSTSSAPNCHHASVGNQWGAIAVARDPVPDQRMNNPLQPMEEQTQNNDPDDVDLNPYDPHASPQRRPPPSQSRRLLRKYNDYADKEYSNNSTGRRKERRRHEDGGASVRDTPQDMSIDPQVQATLHHREAIRLMEEADGMDGLAKVLAFIQMPLSFLQYGYDLEKNGMAETKITQMYNTTIDALKNISDYYMNLGSNERGELQVKEKTLTVFSLRIQALLNFRLFKLNKSKAAKLRIIINQHNSSTSRSCPKTLVPSVYQPSYTPPLSPSTAGSVNSVGSGGSCSEPKTKNGNVGSSTGSVHQGIHSVMQDYLKYTHPLELCHDLWDQAEAMITDHHAHAPTHSVDGEIKITDWFSALDKDCGRLTMQSSVPEIVRYFREGIQRLKNTSS